MTLKTNEELQQIVDRAQELQDEANANNTKKEAQHIAAELGIAPEHVNTAIAEKANKKLPTAQPTDFSWMLVPVVLLLLGGVYWWMWGSQTTHVAISQEEIIISNNTKVTETHHNTIINTNIGSLKITKPEANIEEAFTSQLALLEEARPLIGGETVALDELVVKFRASNDLQEKINLMLRLNRGLHDPVFFQSPIGNAKAKSILEENSRLHTLFFFAKAH
jgi:hypothetical protein